MLLEWFCRSVGPTFWSRVKYLKNYCLDGVKSGTHIPLRQITLTFVQFFGELPASAVHCV